MRRYCVPTGNNKIIKPIEFFTKKGESGTFLSLLFAAYIDLTNIDKREARKAMTKAKRAQKKANPKPKRPTTRKSPKAKSPVAIAPASANNGLNTNTNTIVNNAVTTVPNGYNTNTNANKTKKQTSPNTIQFGNFPPVPLNSPNKNKK
jgi:hypothetical protein